MSAARIRTLLGDARYARLFHEVRKRLEEDGELARTATLRDASREEREAVADLFGWGVVPEGKITLPLEKLDRELRAGAVAAGLREVVEALGGPIVDRRALRASEAEEVELRWARAAQHPVVVERVELRAWLEELRRSGLVGRAARGLGISEEEVLARAIDAVSRLPASGVALAVLAAEVTGDAHALDPGRPLGAIVLRAAAKLAGWNELPASASSRRMLWGEVGVICDPLSSQVLVIGVSLQGEGRLERRLREAAADGEPQRITLRELAGRALVPTAGRPLFVCENPSVVAAAADGPGRHCAPLICTEGVPSTAALTLLRELARHGATPRVRADFDWAGVRIGNQILREVAGQPWRFHTSDYVASLAHDRDGMALEGAAISASWDSDLSRAMQSHGRAIYEEQLLALLLEDLGS